MEDSGIVVKMNDGGVLTSIKERDGNTSDFSGSVVPECVLLG